jgi:hypothetical protein
MSRTSLLSIVSATLVLVGTAYWINAREPRKPWPKPTPPPPPSDVYIDSKERVLTEEEIAQVAAEHDARAEAEIEAALHGNDEVRLQGAFVFLLPEMLQLDPGRVVALVARQQPGRHRDRLRTEVTRQWVMKDLPAAAQWMRTLDDRERRHSAKIAIDLLTPIDPAQVALLVKELAIGGVDLEDLVSVR